MNSYRKHRAHELVTCTGRLGRLPSEPAPSDWARCGTRRDRPSKPNRSAACEAACNSRARESRCRGGAAGGCTDASRASERAWVSMRAPIRLLRVRPSRLRGSPSRLEACIQFRRTRIKHTIARTPRMHARLSLLDEEHPLTPSCNLLHAYREVTPSRVHPSDAALHARDADAQVNSLSSEGKRCAPPRAGCARPSSGWVRA